VSGQEIAALLVTAGAAAWLARRAWRSRGGAGHGEANKTGGCSSCHADPAAKRPERFDDPRRSAVARGASINRDP